MTTEPLTLTLIDRVRSQDASCRQCGGRQYEVVRHRRKCFHCGARQRRQEGAIHRQTVQVDPAHWPLRSTTVDRHVYEDIRANGKPKAFRD